MDGPPIQLPGPVAKEGVSRVDWASRTIRRNIGKIEKDADAVPIEDANAFKLLPVKERHYKGDGNDKPLKVGIVGAGAAGLFTAMIFDHLKKDYGLDVEYEILEADTRVGGRLFSYQFPGTDPPPAKQQPQKVNHNYYDVGAMRFPDTKVMDRTFGLFKLLGMEIFKPSKDIPLPAKGALIPYYFEGPNQPALFNGKQFIKEPGEELKAKDFDIPGLPAHIVDQGAGSLITKTIQKYLDLYKNNEPEFWKLLKSEADTYTVRQWLAKQEGYDYNTIEFLETMNSWYDQALSEMILETIDFDDKADWYCIEGGTQQIAQIMQSKLDNQNALQLGRRVTAISYTTEERKQLKVTVEGEKENRTYDTVFNSVPLGAMGHMQLEGLQLGWGTKQAIRSLGYGASCKVGVRFRDLWWIEDCNIRQGGQGKTDPPIRTCVYPSYNIHDKTNEPGVLLVSYTWSQEAERIGSLINRDSPNGEEKLKAVLIHDLARLHSKSGDEADYQRMFEIISKSYITHYAYNWYSNPFTAGAFAYFGPQQFRELYPDIICNDGKHIIIGEAASTQHAWVVGALESATRGVYQFVHELREVNKAADDVATAFEDNRVERPYGPLPTEFAFSSEIQVQPSAPSDAPHEQPKPLQPEDLPAPVGGLIRLLGLFESIRLEQGVDRIIPGQITKDQVSGIISAVGA